MQHFDINVHASEEAGKFQADFYALAPVPGTAYTQTDTSVTLAVVDVSEAINATDFEYLHDPDDGAWYGTDEHIPEDLPEALAEALADTIERLRA